VWQSTEDAVAAIQGIGATIRQISEIAGTIVAAVQQHRTATQKIAQRVPEVALSSGLASSSMESVTEAPVQTDTAAEAVAAGWTS
jgi:methyl-accepting chemotaxis protein